MSPEVRSFSCPDMSTSVFFLGAGTIGHICRQRSSSSSKTLRDLHSTSRAQTPASLPLCFHHTRNLMTGQRSIQKDISCSLKSQLTYSIVNLTIENPICNYCIMLTCSLSLHFSKSCIIFLDTRQARNSCKKLSLDRGRPPLSWRLLLSG